MQIVYISNRPQVMRETWQHVRFFMPWVDRAVIVAPSGSHAAFGAWVADEDITIVSDEEISGLDPAALQRLDHVRRNVTLRRSLIAAGRTDDVFLLSDDDYRPMRDVPETFFTDGTRDIGYYSYELAEWPGHETDFDRAQHVTHDALAFLGLPHLAYGAHMPQIMRRDLWTEAFEQFEKVSTDSMVCEWALYFNVAQHLHPERFQEPRPFETMCWPQYGAEWPWWVRPSRWTFENFYDDLYLPNHLFDGLPTALDPANVTRTNFEKISRWTEFARAAERLEFPAGVYNPWTKDSALRKLYFRAMRPARKAYHHLSPTKQPDGRT
ncbi:MAG: hypothetical protein U0Q22_08375 [Acidimicrobiales bacterium]